MTEAEIQHLFDDEWNHFQRALEQLSGGRRVAQALERAASLLDSIREDWQTVQKDPLGNKDCHQALLDRAIFRSFIPDYYRERIVPLLEQYIRIVPIPQRNLYSTAVGHVERVATGSYRHFDQLIYKLRRKEPIEIAASHGAKLFSDLDWKVINDASDAVRCLTTLDQQPRDWRNRLNLMEDNYKAAADYIEKHPGCYHKNVAKHLKITTQSFTSHVWPKLKELGFRIGDQRRGCWPPEA